MQREIARVGEREFRLTPVSSISRGDCKAALGNN